MKTLLIRKGIVMDGFILYQKYYGNSESSGECKMFFN